MDAAIAHQVNETDLVCDVLKRGFYGTHVEIPFIQYDPYTRGVEL